MLVMTLHQQTLERLNTKKRRGEKVEGISALSRELHMTSTSFPLTMSLSTLMGIIVSIAQVR